MAQDGLIAHKYGIGLPQQATDFEVELFAFRDPHLRGEKYLDRTQHFKNAADMLWGPETHAWKVGHGFVWHPWADRMLDLACEHSYLGVIGCASSGKTDFFAIWALINWLADPENTMVLVTSTSLKDSRKRIWGSIVKYYQYIPQGAGKLVDSMGIIRTDNGSGIYNDKCGIALIAGEKSKEREAIGKLIGMKNKRVFLVGDELPELSEALLEAAYSNLATNPFFQMIGIGNFASIYDPLGLFVTPKAGWDSVTPADDGWETERGYCVRFDGLKSPNIMLGEDKWPIYNNAMLAKHRASLGENTVGFWRMVRSYPCPEGVENVIYTEADFIMGMAHDAPVWLSSPTRVAGFDPSYTTGGDRSMLMLGWCGLDKDGTQIVAYDRYILLREDVRLKDKPRNFQIAEQFRDICIKEGIQPKHAGMDATGPGIVFHDIVAQVWSPQVLAVQFGGEPSMLPAGVSDMRPSKEVYFNRVSELWHVGLDYVKSSRIRGLPKDMAREMKARQYHEHASKKIRLESKREMKERIGYSPDIADAGFILLDVCRQRLGFKPGRIPGSGGASPFASIKERRVAIQQVFEDVDYSDQDYGEVYAGYSERE